MSGFQFGLVSDIRTLQRNGGAENQTIGPCSKSVQRSRWKMFLFQVSFEAYDTAVQEQYRYCISNLYSLLLSETLQKQRQNK